MKSLSVTARPVTIAANEIVELAQFIASQSGREPAAVESHLRWFLLENPARDPALSLGCGLRSPQGELVGCMLHVPQIFRFQQQTFPVILASSLYVEARYRGNGGVVLFRKFMELGSKWPIFTNSANPVAAVFWRSRRAVPIPYTDHELLGVLRWQGMIEEGLVRRGVPNLAARAASGPAGLFVRPFRRFKLDGGSPDDLVPLASAEDVLRLPMQGSQSEMTANRDLEYIRWRYFSRQDATVAAFAFRNKRSGTEVLVTVNRRPRGYRGQINTLNLLDIFPAVAPEVCVSIVAGLAERYRGAVDAIVLRGLDEARQDLFGRLGFMRRQFDAPNGWFVDRSGTLPTRNWYMVPADGDWLI